MNEKSTRFFVLELLEKMEKNAYSNLALDGAFEKSSYCKAEKAFAARLFYGVTERKITLDYIISLYSNLPLQRIDSVVKNSLRIGLYQICYMNSVPECAAVDESVKLTSLSGKKSAAGFVNALLRGFIRNGKKFELPKDRLEQLSVKYSCNVELVNCFCNDYGEETAEKFLAASLDVHQLFVRVNNLKTDSDKLISMLTESGIEGSKYKNIDNCLKIEKYAGVENGELFKNGLFHVQDLSSQICCEALGANENEQILDICAAPGGKCFTIAEIMNNTGEIYACDLHEKRVSLIKKGAERLGITNIKAVCNDAKVFNKDFPSFDRVICDVPCSGTGVIRSKPEIKYADINKIAALPDIQLEILSSAANYLKAGGTLVYSTCSILKDENEMVIERFLKNNMNFTADNISRFNSFEHTVFPDEFGCEGFFMCRLKKIN